MAMGTKWVKSSFSNFNGSCVEVQGAQVRDSKLGSDSPVLSFSPEAWSAFIQAQKSS